MTNKIPPPKREARKKIIVALFYSTDDIKKSKLNQGDEKERERKKSEDATEKIPWKLHLCLLFILGPNNR